MRWDIFCQILDNYGDAGVCWRLARSLTSLHGQEVRIFCNDLPTINLLASGVDDSIRHKIELLPWDACNGNAYPPLITPDVVIEAFGCELPERYLACLFIASQKPIIINLEYLSAEPWIVDFHAKASPQSHGIAKYFFFPGYQDEVGGLLLDPMPPEGCLVTQKIPAALEPTWARLRLMAKRISIFCYPGAPLREWLENLASLGQEIDILLTHGHAELLGLIAEQKIDSPATVQLISMPFVSQDEYDWVLSQCDLNIVRGEDSFVRAQLAGKPFIWHIYQQNDQAHEVKLRAFLNIYLETAQQDLKFAVIEAMNWAKPSEWFGTLDVWDDHAQAWRTQLLQKHEDGGLAARLLRFVS